MRKWLGPTTLFLLGSWLAHAAAFNAWLSWGPPTATPEWHRRWSYVFAIASLASFTGSLIVLRRARRELPRPTDLLTD